MWGRIIKGQRDYVIMGESVDELYLMTVVLALFLENYTANWFAKSMVIFSIVSI